MITGRVTPALEAVVRLQIRGQSGKEIELGAVLDTGFNDQLTLPPSVIRSLNLPFQTIGEATLAGEVVVSTNYFRAAVLWGGRERQISILELEGAPLLGMALLVDHHVALDVAVGGKVSINRM